jgi:uncharacterized protein (DUF934 family)
MSQILLLGTRTIPVPTQWQEPPLTDTPAADTGLLWPNDADVYALLPLVDALDGISLQFPAFADGRAYSQARVLRRLGYAGHLQARGQAIALDQALELRAAGFDSVVLRDDQNAAQWTDWLARNPETGVFTADRAAFLRRRGG